MFIALGVLTGFLGFLPMFIALRLSRRSTSTQALTIGLYGRAGAAVSLVVLIIGLVACGLFARESLISYVIAEILTFLVSTVTYVFYKNVFAKRKRK